MGNPWEIVRNDVSYPVKFYGEVVQGPDGRKEWIGGEDIMAVAYDVPIPGYSTFGFGPQKLLWRILIYMLSMLGIMLKLMRPLKMQNRFEFIKKYKSDPNDIFLLNCIFPI